MSKHKFVYLLIILVLWMLHATFSASSAKAELNAPYTIAGYHTGMHIADARKNCQRPTKFNYKWLGDLDDDMTGCFIDPAKITPPRELMPEETALGAYRHLQSNPAIVLLVVDKHRVVSILTIYFEPEQWSRELGRMAKNFEKTSTYQEKHPNGVDYDVNVYYNEDSKANLQAWYWYPGIDFDTPFGPDAEHIYNPKDRMYVIEYAGTEM